MSNEQDAQQLAELAEYWQPKEGVELCPELQAHLSESPVFGQHLHHPLIIQIPYFPQFAHQANESIRRKREAIAQYEAEGDWMGVLILHERPYRSEKFMEIAEQITDDAKYWDLVRYVWTDTENLHQWGENIFDILHPGREGRSDHLMDDDERALLASLPDEITVWRGYNENDEIGDEGYLGWSWTLDRDKACWFARRFAAHRGTAMLAEAIVRKKDVIAIFLGRGEQEVVFDPEDIDQILSMTEPTEETE